MKHKSKLQQSADFSGGTHFPQKMTGRLSRFFIFLIIVCSVFLIGRVPEGLADPFPPTTGNGARHYAPAMWPGANPWDVSDTSGWIPTSHNGNTDNDPRDGDDSNGGTRPRNYVNVSSGCTDKSLPSIYWAYDSGTQTIFFRWRVMQIANTYATGPSPGSYSSGDPWGAALWTVFFDIDGDGFREFAVHLDGSGGSPSTPIDMVAGIYSNTRSQSIDYENDPNIHLVAHNPTAFVASDDGSDNTILNYHSSLSPDTSWPNGSNETVWDYGTTRSVEIIDTPKCVEYFVDYQIPLGLLDASAVGGP
ncbi:MAG: hypothetical protein V2I97_20540, partial [Desulfococcaceae bacterium]|nr:hypothetical protein [Desulfococcaceae bacterium]